MLYEVITFNAIKALFPHQARLQLYQVHAVTEGTDAQATVSVRLEENGKIATGQASDTDTIVITSYSIHYTKLYEPASRNSAMEREPIRFDSASPPGPVSRE